MRKEFYQSQVWKSVRKAKWIEQDCCCSVCGRPVYVAGVTDYIPKENRLVGIMHHKEYLTEENLSDDSIALAEDNLTGLCIDCHNKEHKSMATRKGLLFDSEGNLVKV